MSKKPVVLIIRDGWGENPGGVKTAEAEGNAVILANTPVHDKLLKNYPYGKLSASGLDVGLPEGQMGNSEVGHLNLGAGRVVYQTLTRINKDITDDVLKENKALQEAFQKARNGGGRLHFIGLVSDGGVHSHQDHLIELTKLANEAGLKETMVHAITDGRDTSPKGGKEYLKEVQSKIEPYGAKIATVIGRYYAMDRDQRWERNQLAWDAIVHGKGELTSLSPSDAVAERYANETDEFMKPLIFSHASEQRVNDGDVVVSFNFRADRARQLSQAFLQEDFDGFNASPRPNVHFVTMSQYDESYDCAVLFPPLTHQNTLGKAVADAGLNQLRIAETEKYPHVTYFFNGGEEKPNSGEDRHIIPSPKVATYDLQPEMNADQVTAVVLEKLSDYNLVIINFANPDMVGHTGSVEAAIKSVETIDKAVGEVVEKTLSIGGKLLITADHGNCEQMLKPDGAPHTAHTTNLVNIIYVAEDAKLVNVKDGILADVAPTLLDMLETGQPTEMTGQSLLTL